MKYDRMLYAAGLAILLAVTSAQMSGQGARSTDEKPVSGTRWTVGRTSWGDPDLRGVWRPDARVPLERPAAFGGREFLTDAEIAERQVAAEERRAKAIEQGGTVSIGVQGFAFFTFGAGDEPVRISRRTSAIIDPPDGRLPAWTPEQIKRFEARVSARRHRGEADSWMDQGYNERCLRVVEPAVVSTLRYTESGGRDGGRALIRTKRLMQVPGYVVIVKEEIGEYVIIPLDGRPPLGPRLRQYVGDARGRWDGDTLVVEITNVNDQQDGGATLPVHLGVSGLTSPETEMYPGSGATLRVTERYTRVDADTLEYRATIEDPAVYVRPYTVLHEMSRDDNFFSDPYQCQENNQMNGVISAARADEVHAKDIAAQAQAKWRETFEALKAEWAQRPIDGDDK